MPTFTMNFISIGSLIDQGFIIIFDNEQCMVLGGLLLTEFKKLGLAFTSTSWMNLS
jgi:hypothetical protein